MKKIITMLLHSISRAILRRYQPTVIGITGSVGKTTAKEAVFSVLATTYRVRKNVGNYNTEIGLPLTIIGAHAPGRSFLKWLRTFATGIRLLIWKSNYPEILVLEMGSDKPGDIAQLLRVVTPDIGVITAIASTHTEKFGSIAGVAREKGQLFSALPERGWAVVNHDDARVKKMAASCAAHTVGYAITHADEVDIKAAEIAISYSKNEPTGIAGISFKLVSNGTVTPVLLKGIAGEHAVYAALAAAAIAKIQDVHNVHVAEGLAQMEHAPGRMRVLAGIKKTTLIDDSYNSSPAALRSALETLAKINTDKKRYAVLGDMLELGTLSSLEHQKAGQFLKKLGIDVLIVVGERARDIARGAKRAGMSDDHIFAFSGTKEAGLFLQNRMHEGDVVLIKGSHGVGLERIVKEVMAEPERADELLVKSAAHLRIS